MFHSKTFNIDQSVKDEAHEEAMQKIASYLDAVKKQAKKDGKKIVNVFSVTSGDIAFSHITVFHDTESVSRNKNKQKKA